MLTRGYSEIDCCVTTELRRLNDMISDDSSDPEDAIYCSSELLRSQVDDSQSPSSSWLSDEEGDDLFGGQTLSAAVLPEDPTNYLISYDINFSSPSLATTSTTLGANDRIGSA